MSSFERRARPDYIHSPKATGMHLHFCLHCCLWIKSNTRHFHRCIMRDDNTDTWGYWNEGVHLHVRHGEWDEILKKFARNTPEDVA